MAAESPRYFLSISQTVRDRFLALNYLAESHGILLEWVQTIRLALERLEVQPDKAGDPLSRFRHLQLTNYRLMLNRICIFYAVHDWERIVIIKKIVPLLDHPLEGMA